MSRPGFSKYDGLTKSVIEVIEVLGPIGPADIVKMCDCVSNASVCWGVLLALVDMGVIERIDNGTYQIAESNWTDDDESYLNSLGF